MEQVCGVCGILITTYGITASYRIMFVSPVPSKITLTDRKKALFQVLDFIQEKWHVNDWGGAKIEIEYLFLNLLYSIDAPGTLTSFT